MMQMLIGAGLPVLTDGAREADEDNPRGYLEYAPVMAPRRDSSWLGDARGYAVKIVAPLLPALPEGHDYRVVWMNRDLDEVLASQQRMLERSGGAADGGDADCCYAAASVGGARRNVSGSAAAGGSMRVGKTTENGMWQSLAISRAAQPRPQPRP